MDLVVEVFGMGDEEEERWVKETKEEAARGMVKVERRGEAEKRWKARENSLKGGGGRTGCVTISHLKVVEARRLVEVRKLTEGMTQFGVDVHFLGPLVPPPN
ncbi:MAG: hypothetical protein LQ343_004252 [Gyalolechia ehrenbergii]|nr:MAG: hypothetical protein LQ343_004252 [Gyalolechia ehrenbergii]